ncbi:ABC transporter permease [Thermocrinis jamiesonii]|jgi:ABC-type transport system, involved in lipoprotein release, permease component|uniref:ABC transporter permease n=1 Tax=Thermocrinis jamiesonii TaxID=1302351 RepID=UPI0004966F53|nr:ABC transporter permease [Thermocrinis jamiesonii]
MSLILRLAIRYLTSVKGSALLVSLIAFLGISLSVSAILLTMGTFSGFQKALKEKILSTTPHVIISVIEEGNYEVEERKLKNLPEVKNVIYVTIYQGMISKEGRVQAVSVKGMKKEEVGLNAEGGVLVGEGLASLLGIGLWDEIVLISPFSVRTPLGFVPKVGYYKVVGFIKTGTFEQDYLTVIMPIEDAQKFFGQQWQLKGYEVYIKDPYLAQEVKEKIGRIFGSKAFVSSWIDLNRQLFNALQLEKMAIFFVLLLMATLSSFNITSLLFMKVRDKVRDIAVLRTYGFKRKDIMLTFLMQGLILGFSGAVFGTFLAFVGQFLINHYRLIRVPSEVYLMDHIPSNIELVDGIITFVLALLISLLASLIPAYRAGKLSVVEILRKD